MKRTAVIACLLTFAFAVGCGGSQAAAPKTKVTTTNPPVRQPDPEEKPEAKADAFVLGEEGSTITAFTWALKFDRPGADWGWIVNSAPDSKGGEYHLVLARPDVKAVIVVTLYNLGEASTEEFAKARHAETMQYKDKLISVGPLETEAGGKRFAYTVMGGDPKAPLKTRVILRRVAGDDDPRALHILAQASDSAFPLVEGEIMAFVDSIQPL
jgi:hypothetical protein